MFQGINWHAYKTAGLGWRSAERLKSNGCRATCRRCGEYRDAQDGELKTAGAHGRTLCG